jgi:hypothetical protein
MADFPIVGVGSSAGGLEALQKMFSAMPTDSGLGFIIAAHLDPTQKSHMTELLSRCTKMPVVQIENSIKVEPDHVYVIAPDQELTIRDGVVRTHKPAAPRGHRHPVDSFFRSLAEDQGERAIDASVEADGGPASARPEPRARAGELMDRALLDRYAPASVLIDQNFRVHYLRGPTEDICGRRAASPRTT